eukprot:snap_masked-scaffold_5-processed-gene-5.19-mRNA-1 protein AED:1.00 eAED:1.00 QI:0/0/0/0/1/1/5/0/966
MSSFSNESVFEEEDDEKSEKQQIPKIPPRPERIYSTASNNLPPKSSFSSFNEQSQGPPLKSSLSKFTTFKQRENPQGNQLSRADSGFESEFEVENFINDDDPVTEHEEEAPLAHSLTLTDGVASPNFSSLGVSGVGNFDQLHNLKDGPDIKDWRHDLDRQKRKRSPLANCCGGLVSMIIIGCYFLLFTFLPGFTNTSLFSVNLNRRAEIQQLSEAFLYTGITGIVLYLVLDFPNATAKLKYFGSVVVVLCGVLVLVSLVVLARDIAVIPYAIYLLAAGIFGSIIKSVFFRDADGLDYLTSVLIPVVLSMALTLAGFSIFFRNHRWINIVTQAQYLRESGCDTYDEIEKAIFEEMTSQTFDGDQIKISPSQDDVMNNAFFRTLGKRAVDKYLQVVANRSVEFGDDFGCEQRALDLYISPLYFVLIGLMMCLVIFEIAKLERIRRRERSEVKLGLSTQILVVVIGLLSISAWVSTSLFNTGDTDFSSLIVGSVVIIVGVSATTVIYVFGVSYVRVLLTSIPLGQAVLGIIRSSWIPALAIFFGIFPLFILAGFSIIIQSVRKYTFFGKTIKHPYEQKLLVTKEIDDVFEWIRGLDYGHVYDKIMSIGLFFFIFVVIVNRFINIFLSVLGEQLAGLSIPVTTVIFIVIGLGCFLLPPVPGLPVFLFGGILLFTGTEEVFGLGSSLLYAVAVNFLLKLLAVALQQKVIGQTFGSKSVRIKAIVNINSPSIKAIKILLRKPGLSFPKIAILCGGPDWPTSVLTGLLKLSLPQMLIGTTPVILLVLPSTLAGAFLIYGPNDEIEEEEDQELTDRINNLRAIFLTSTIMVQGFFFVVALHYIMKTQIEQEKEIAAIPDDEDVTKYNMDNLNKIEETTRLKSWENLDDTFKKGHFIAGTLMIVSCLLFQFLGTFAFVTFEVTNTVGEKLDGSILNVFKPLGWVLLAVFLSAVFYNWYFNRVISKAVALVLKRSV